MRAPTAVYGKAVSRRLHRLNRDQAGLNGADKKQVYATLPAEANLLRRSDTAISPIDRRLRGTTRNTLPPSFHPMQNYTVLSLCFRMKRTVLLLSHCAWLTGRFLCIQAIKSNRLSNNLLNLSAYKCVLNIITLTHVPQKRSCIDTNIMFGFFVLASKPSMSSAARTQRSVSEVQGRTHIRAILLSLWCRFRMSGQK